MSIINTAEVQRLKKIKLDKAGGTLTGPLYLSGDPTNEFEAVNKGILDQEVTRIDNTISTLNGALNISRFEFSTPSSEWVVQHNMGTTRFNEKLLDVNERAFFAGVEVVDANTFKVHLSGMVVGAVEVSFGY